MPSSCPGDVKIIRREEKVSRLTDFVTEAIAASHGVIDIAIVARSFESPVISAVSAELSKRGHGPHGVTAGVRTLIVNGDAPRQDTDIRHLGEIRYAINSRLKDAHEQLVINDCAWIGDAMRRDPDKIDSFERFVAQGDEAGIWAAMAFNRLWSACATGVHYHTRSAPADFANLPLPAQTSASARDRLTHRD